MQEENIVYKVVPEIKDGKLCINTELHRSACDTIQRIKTEIIDLENKVTVDALAQLGYVKQEWDKVFTDLMFHEESRYGGIHLDAHFVEQLFIKYLDIEEPPLFKSANSQVRISCRDGAILIERISDDD
jgi:hypothetical protein